MAERPASGRELGGPNRQGTAVIDDAVSIWFVREIVPLEAKLMRYLQHNWRNASDVPDLRQEVYVRVLQGAQGRIPDSPEKFLLSCARNLLIDIVRREQIVPIETFADLDTLGIASDAPEPDRQVMKREELRRLEAAVDQLPVRKREAIRFAYFEGLTGREVAKRMGITESRVSHHLSEGVITLGDILYDACSEPGAKL
jgi:RNA polymerase sigma-70 factor (ECF subfamily)